MPGGRGGGESWRRGAQFWRILAARRRASRHPRRRCEGSSADLPWCDAVFRKTGIGDADLDALAAYLTARDAAELGRLLESDLGVRFAFLAFRAGLCRPFARPAKRKNTNLTPSSLARTLLYSPVDERNTNRRVRCTRCTR
jgi:hypothetical protein